MANLYIICRDFTLNSGSYAGMIEEFAKYCHEKGYSVKILCARLNKNLPKNEKIFFAEIIRFDIPFFKIPLLGMNNDYIFLSFSVRKYLKRVMTKEDIIFANGRAALGLCWSKNLRNKYFVRIGQPAMTFLRNMEIANNKVSIMTRIARKIHFKFQSYLEKISLKYATGLIIPSLETKNDIFHQYKIEMPFFVPQSGIKDIFFKIKKEKRKDNKIRMLFVNSGTEEIRKGIYYLKEALPKIFSLDPNLNMLHVGDNIKWPEEFKNRIICYGKVPYKKMPYYYAKADFLISTSLNEGMPNTILESMASGLPVLSSDIQGIKEYISNGKEGYIFRRGDLNSLINGVKFMLSSNLISMGHNAKKKIYKLRYDNYLTELMDFLISKKSKNILIDKNGLC